MRGPRPDAAAAPGVVSLDTAAAGRPSVAVVEAAVAQIRAEADRGAYPAEEAAETVVAELRAGLARLHGAEPDGVALVGSASDARDLLLDAWGLRPGSRVGVVPSEWGPNLDAFAARGLVPQWLPVADSGDVDLDRLQALLRTDPPAVIHLDAVCAHRGLWQPVADVAALARARGVPVWVDLAQAAGHRPDLAALGADAVYGTSRKWLRGPRGAGFLIVDRASWDRLGLRPGRSPRPAAGPVPALEPGEVSVAARVGLGVAVAELERADPVVVGTRLAELGDRTRSALAGLTGWALLPGQRGAITALRPTAGQDVLRVRAQLLEAGVLVSACLPWRAPAELGGLAVEVTGRPPVGPLLRLSPHLEVGAAGIDRLATLLPRT